MQKVVPWVQYLYFAQREYMIRVIDECQGDIPSIISKVGESRQTIYRWIDKYNLEDHLNNARREFGTGRPYLDSINKPKTTKPSRPKGQRYV